MSQIGERIKGLPLKRELADCQEWMDATGKKFYIRELTGDERLEYEQKQLEGGIDADGEMDKRKFVSGMKSLRQELVVQSLIDEQYEQVFDHVTDLESVSGEIVARLADQAMKVSGLVGEAVQDAIKNSGEGQSAATG